AGGFALELQLDARVIAALHDTVPADHHRPQASKMLLSYKQQSGAFGAEQPFVTVGGQKINAVGLHVNRKNAEPLNRIQKKQEAGPAAHLSDFAKMDPPAGGIADPAHGENPRPRIASGSK